LQKDDKDRKVFIFYQDYDPHIGPNYAGRVELLKDNTGQYGQAAIKLSNVKISDRGRYVCNVLFADRSPMRKTGPSGNGTVVYLDVHGWFNIHCLLVLLAGTGETATIYSVSTTVLYLFFWQKISIVISSVSSFTRSEYSPIVT
jgi:hypothetical protein